MNLFLLLKAGINQIRKDLTKQKKKPIRKGIIFPGITLWLLISGNNEPTDA